MNVKFGWILRKIDFKLAVNDTLNVLIISKPSLRLSAFALKLTEMLIEVTFWHHFRYIFTFSDALKTKLNAKVQRRKEDFDTISTCGFKIILDIF